MEVQVMDVTDVDGDQFEDMIHITELEDVIIARKEEISRRYDT